MVARKVLYYKVPFRACALNGLLTCEVVVRSD
ncbi:hypothetical protein SAMN05421543_104184 [Alicyclobacillus macrosporangiidus]|uniref:Uncharacterized protein n=1 Tax=Alicyclobacillus macrosporangiidus TaxID=392015 RepID=A0A1I7HGS3_9BACL|nr:hypothetical protein SAMN05421543_104184 [Alicyclobacillus macrosporangiidus]